MEEYVEVMRRSVELAETCMEGLYHIRARIQEGMFEETMYLFEDIVYGYCQIAEFLPALDSFLTDDRLGVITCEIEEALHSMLTAYEYCDINKAAYIVNNQLISGFQLWSRELMTLFSS